jgi:hypothetical protein
MSRRLRDFDHLDRVLPILAGLHRAARGRSALVQAYGGELEAPHIEFGYYKGRQKWPTVMHIPDILNHAPSDYDLQALTRVKRG